MLNAALGAIITLAFIFAAAMFGAWWLANLICDYFERGRH